jgi:membrane associated rhomboid family serine protease
MFPISDSIASRGFPFINLLLIGITVYVFFLQVTAPDLDTFIYQYALIPSLVDFNHVSTLTPFVTAIFLHGGYFHIFTNMWFLWVFGDNVEDHIGFFMYPIIYLLSGIVGNVAQYLVAPSSSIPMLGASGAVAGVLGSYFVLFPHAKIKTLVPFFGFFSFLDLSAPFMLGYWFVLQIFSGVASFGLSESGGVAFWAHVGGFVTGFIIAKIFYGRAKEDYGLASD